MVLFRADYHHVFLLCDSDYRCSHLTEEKEILDAVGNLLEAHSDGGSRAIDLYYSAFMKETGKKPHEIALVHWLTKDGASIWQLVTLDEAKEIMDAPDSKFEDREV